MVEVVVMMVEMGLLNFVMIVAVIVEVLLVEVVVW